MAESPEVKVRLTAEDQGVSAAIRQLGSELKNLKTQQDQTRSSAVGLKDAFAGLLGAISIYSVVALGKSLLDTAVQIGKLSDQTGISTETLSVFHKVAEDVGVSTEAVDKGLVRAAKNITLFQAGNAQAAQAMKLLGLSAKDFIGLNSDEKLEKVVTALGKMPASFEKATASQLLFSRGGQEMINVANAIAAQGFDKARDATAELGLMLSGQMVTSARAAKASLQEVEDVGKGMATQLEAGLLPAVADIGEALVKNSGRGGEGFVKLGEYIGDAVKLIVEGAMAIGKIMGTAIAAAVDAFEFLWREIEQGGRRALGALGAVSAALTGDFVDAWKMIRAADSAGASEEVTRLKGMFSALRDDLVSIDKQLFPSAEEEARRMNEREARLRTAAGEGGEVPSLTPGRGRAGAEKPQPVLDAAAKAELALALKQQEDLLSVWKMGLAQREEVEKEEYVAGKIELAKYFDDRRAMIEEETAKEIAVLKAERDQMQSSALAAGEHAAMAKGAIPTAASPEEGRALASAADRYAAEQLNDLARVDELNARISEKEIATQTKLLQLEVERGKAEDEITRKRLDAYEAAAQQHSAEAGIQALENDRAAIEIELADRKLSEKQADQQITALLLQQLPILRQKADLELQAAEASGDQQRIAQAQQTIEKIQQMQQVVAEFGHKWHETLGQAATGAFQTFISSITSGTQNVGQAFLQLELTVISALERMAAQMIIAALTQKKASQSTKFSDAAEAARGAFKSAVKIPYVGWILAPVAAAAAFAMVASFAKGGLVNGPGGPTSDRVPAMLSAGEFVVNAEGVKGFGAHNLEAINKGLASPAFAAGIATMRPAFAASIARPGDFRTRSFQMPEDLGHGGTYHDQSETNITLYHNGPDARQILENELVPRLLEARRMGRIPIPW